MAPAAASHCGPEPATIAGSARAKKPRIPASNDDAQRHRAGVVAATQDQYQQLQQAGDADSRGQDRGGEARLLSPDHQRDRDRDQRDVEQQRGKCRQREAALRAGERQHHGGGTREGEIGQHQPRVIDGERQRIRSGKSRRQHAHHERHRKAEQQGRNDQGRTDGPEHAAGEGRRRACAFRFAQPQPYRHQRRVQRAFAEQAPDDVDELEGRQEGIRNGTGAEQRRQHGIARKAEQARGQRARRDGDKGADHLGSIAAASLAGASPVVIGRSRSQLP